MVRQGCPVRSSIQSLLSRSWHRAFGDGNGAGDYPSLQKPIPAEMLARTASMANSVMK
jgi:hypothetical protein